MNIHRESDLRHERMMEERLEEDRRQAREILQDVLIKIAACGLIVLSVCVVTAVVCAAIIVPFMK